jgi:arylamine N-acetyltransferase
VDVGAYLERIGLTRPPTPTLDGLAELGLAHLCAVPFENLDIAAGRPLSLDPDALYDKIVVRRRGGFCYELNGLFGQLLTSTSASTRPLSGASRTVSTCARTSSPTSTPPAAGSRPSHRSSPATASAPSPRRPDGAR